MRKILIALLLTLAFAGSAEAQQRVRTGPQPAAAAAPATQKRAISTRMVRQAKSRALVPARGRKVSPSVRSSESRRPHGPRTKRPAPRS